MGLFVVGRLAARHGIRVRLRHVHPHGVSALVWLPGTVAQLETVPPLGPLARRFNASAHPASAPVVVPAPTAATHPAGSDWFRRGDTFAGTAEVQPPASSRTSPADTGFRPARAVVSPATGDTSPSGLPRRMPNANLVPGSIGRPAGQPAGAAETRQQAGQVEHRQPATGPRRRSPEEVRTRLAEFQRGAHQARSDTPRNFGAAK
jgi:hypothetical protein